MKHFCPYCGWRLDDDDLCDGCGERVGDAVGTPEQDIAHGERCHSCAGTGLVEVHYTERHPYGDTYATEILTDLERCADCGGLGYFLDGSTCIGCGKPVVDGCLVQGWEVHEACMEETLPILQKKIDSGPSS